MLPLAVVVLGALILVWSLGTLRAPAPSSPSASLLSPGTTATPSHAAGPSSAPSHAPSTAPSPQPTSTTTTAPAKAPAPAPKPAPQPVAGIWHPRPGTSWQWQITGTVDTSVAVRMYDIDLFDAQPAASSYSVPGFGTVNVPRGVNAGVIGRLHASGRVVICYMDTGAWENYRPDAALFPRSVIGNNTGWNGENWMDIRQSSWSKFEPLITARMSLAKRSGCDGVEGDQNNPWGNNPGFPIALADQKSWYLEVARQLHTRGLSAGQKNGIETTDATTVSAFDWDLNEECNKYSECGVLGLYIAAGKAVFQVEYTEEGETTATFCPPDNRANFDGLLKHLALGVWLQACR